MAALSQHSSKFTYIPSGQEGVHFFVFCCWQASRLCWIYWIWTNPFLDSQMTFLGPLFSQIRFKFQIFYLIKRREDNPEFKKTGCACIRDPLLCLVDSVWVLWFMKWLWFQLTTQTSRLLEQPITPERCWPRATSESKKQHATQGVNGAILLLLC